MATNNSINSGALATPSDAIAGTDQIKLISPATLRSIIDNRVSENLGMKISGSSLVLCAENGTDLSSTNKARIKIKSAAANGLWTDWELTSNVTIPVGTYAGNIFNTRLNIAWTEDIPFFVYACIRSADAAITFGFSTNPSMRICPSTDVGHPSSQSADSSSGIWVMDTSASLYYGNPVQMLGCFRATKDVANVWTISTLDAEDGIGKFHEGRVFTMPIGQWQANSYMIQASPPIFTDNAFTYTIDRYGVVTCSWSCTGDGGTDGAGTANVQLYFPYEWDWTKTATTNRRGGDATILSTTLGRINATYDTFGTQRISLYRSDTGAYITSVQFNNGDREFSGTFFFTI